MKRMRVVFLSIILLGILLRILALNVAPSNDEMNLQWMMSSGKIFYPEHHAHPPLGNLLLFAFAKIFGTSFVALRLVPFLFELFSLVMLYMITKQLYNEQAGRTAVKLGLLSFIFLGNGTRLHIEPIVSFFFLAAIYFFLRQQRMVAGIMAGLLLLTKFSGILLFPVLFVYSIFFETNWKQRLSSLGIVSFIALGIFLLFPLGSFLLGSSLFQETISFLFSFQGADDNLPFGTLFPFLFVFVTPFYLYLPFLNREKTKKDAFLWLWVILIILFHLFVIKKGDYSRYFLIGIYPLLILAAGGLSRISKKEWKLPVFWSSALGSCLLFFLIQSLFYAAPRVAHGLSNYMNLFLSGEIFFFPYVVDHGYGFGVVSPVFYVLLLGHILLLFFSWKKWMIPVFFGFLFGFNLFLLEENVFSIAQPKISQTMQEIVAYAQQHELPHPYYATDKMMMYLLNPQAYYEGYTTERSLFFSRVEGKNDLAQLQKTGGTFFFFPFAAYITEEQLPPCPAIQEWTDNGVVTGKILVCRKA